MTTNLGIRNKTFIKLTAEKNSKTFNKNLNHLMPILLPQFLSHLNFFDGPFTFSSITSIQFKIKLISY